MGELLNPSQHRGDDSYPVDNIDQNHCQEFIDNLNAFTKCKFRLPTAAEWEFAARGGNLTKGYEHAGSNLRDDVGWFDDMTHRVKLKQPNELGLYDMSGNVWEFCQEEGVVRGMYYGRENITSCHSIHEEFRVNRSLTGFRLALSTLNI